MQRIPVVVVLGHVDHGKTTLLDSIRNTSVQKSEPSGITQNIYISEVDYKGKKITFVDTPGHEVFGLMRAQGGRVADLALLIVAADEGVKPQTLESLEIIKKEELKYIVVITKIDKPGANVDKVKQELINRGVYLEGLGGDIPFVEVSALKNQGIDSLLDHIFLYIEVENLLDDETAKLKLMEFTKDDKIVDMIDSYGVILDSSIHKALGRIGFAVFKLGTLTPGDTIFIEQSKERVSRTLTPEYKPVKNIVAGQAFIMTGLNDLPISGALIVKPKNSKGFEQYLETQQRNQKNSEAQIAQNNEDFLEQLFQEEQEKKLIPFILKCDVEASVRSVLPTIQRFNKDNIEFKKIIASVGDITPNDIDHATAFNAKVIGFRVKANKKVLDLAKTKKIDVKLFDTVYKLYDYLQDLIQKALSDNESVTVVGKARVLKVFELSDKSKVAGSVVIEGVIKRKATARVIRNDEVIAEIPIQDLRVLKDRADTVTKGSECGINLGPNAEIQKDDILEIVTEK